MNARSKRRFVSRAAAIACLVASSFVAPVGAATRSTEPTFRVPLPYVLTVADSLYKIGERFEARHYLDSLLVQVRASKDERLLRQTLYVRGRQNFGVGDARAAERDLREALTLAVAAQDTLLIGHTMRWLGPALEYMARPQESSAMYDSLRLFGRRIHDRYLEAAGIWGHTTEALRSGDLARVRRDFESALAIFREIGATSDEMYALLGFEAFQDHVQEYDGARHTLQRLLELSRKSGSKEIESASLNNLGCIEGDIGDPGEAVRYWRQSLRLSSEATSVFHLGPMLDLAKADVALGKFDDAVALFDSVAQIARSTGVREEMDALFGIAQVRAKQGRIREAKAAYDHILAVGDSISSGVVAGAAIGLARLQPPSEDGLRVLRERTRRIEPRLDALVATELRMEEAHYLMRLRRYDEALRSWRTFPPNLTAAVQIAACERELGHPDSALASLHRASRLWERTRTQPRDPEWREARGALAREFLSELIDLTLTSSKIPSVARARAAFDVAQTFKSRTYLERMSGPNAVALGNLQPDSILSAEQLQREVLRDGELFLDAIVGDRVSFLFAVSRDSLRVARLPAAAALEERIRLYRDLIATIPQDRDGASLQVLDRATASVSRLLFAGCPDLLQSSRRVILSLDGPLHLLSFGELQIPGVSTGVPLAQEREIARIPSGAVLASIRGRREVRAEAANLLVFATSHTPNEVALPGVEREARGLTSRYANVTLHLNDTTGPVPQEELPLFGVLHFASHTSIDDQRPWNSGFLLQPASADVPVRLRASEILAMRLRAHLCVLSGCESAAGKTLTGEGVQSLAGAFLCAGVPTVVATVWPVDDATSARLMHHFYRGLERGYSAAAALREAQALLRRDSRTREPFHWAGFVLVGEPETRVALARRAAWLSPMRDARFAVGLAAGLLGVGLMWFWRQRARVVPRPRFNPVPLAMTAVVLLAGWLVYDRTQGLNDAVRLRSDRPRAVGAMHLRSRAPRALEWDRWTGAESYRLDLVSPALEPLEVIDSITEPHFDLAPDRPKLTGAPDTILVRVVALNSSSTIATSPLRPLALR